MGRHTELTGDGVPAVKLPRPYTYQGRHRADDGVSVEAREDANARDEWTGYWAPKRERPPSPTYSFTVVEQPGGAS